MPAENNPAKQMPLGGPGFSRAIKNPHEPGL
jgi:hypothetical protein